MTGVRSPHGADEANVVHLLGELRKEIADPSAALAVLLELPWRLEQIEGLARDDLGALEGQRPAVVAREKRLIVEGVDLRRAAVHKEEDHTFGARGEVRRLDGEGIRRLSRCDGGMRLFAEQS